MSELLLEIGTEEIPSGFIPPALEEMKTRLEKGFANQRIAFQEVRALGTPRRLVVAATEVALVQESRSVEVVGPARRIAYDEQGRPTRAALGFARNQGVEVEELKLLQTEKGEYVCARREEGGEETFDLLPSILLRLITSLTFPKSMRWMDLEISFVRPIHWILALFGGRVVPFQVGNVPSGNLSRGHRFMAPGPFQVKDFADYLRKLKGSFVIVNPEERRELIMEESRKAAAEVSGAIRVDPELQETVTHLVEFPVAIRGSFAPEYLTLPPEVLISAMREHQRYFSILGPGGKLLPSFVAISNTRPRDPNVVARGNERVLQARLSDARFFFQEDQKAPLSERVEGLKKVVFHSKLGTSYEKVIRIMGLAAHLAQAIDPALKETVERAALLCKADLITGMVGEFPGLQGIMGGVYARLSGESPEVALAISEHYLPTSAGGALPSSPAGAILSLADKMDTIAGCFGVGLVPTGTADPYALRRQTLGVIHIILDKGFRLSWRDFLDKSLELLGEKLERPVAEIRLDLEEFLRGRLQNLLISRGLSFDVVEAAMAAGSDDLVDLWQRAQALEELKSHPDFASLAVAFKRVVNISRSAPSGEVDPELFESPVEAALLKALERIGQEAEEKISRRDYARALRDLSALRAPVDAFFDGVLVMAEDERVRANRLSLLARIGRLFFCIGDFSRIALP